MLTSCNGHVLRCSLLLNLSRRKRDVVHCHMTLKNTDNPLNTPPPRLTASPRSHANTSCWQMWQYHKHFKVPALRPSPCTDANCKKRRTYGLENMKPFKQRLGSLLMAGEDIFITHHLELLRLNCDKGFSESSQNSTARMTEAKSWNYTVSRCVKL